MLLLLSFLLIVNKQNRRKTTEKQSQCTWWRDCCSASTDYMWVSLCNQFAKAHQREHYNIDDKRKNNGRVNVPVDRSVRDILRFCPVH